MIKAVIFDAGGVFVKRMDLMIFKHIAKKFGIDLDLAVSNLNILLKDYQIGNLSQNEFWLRFSKKVKKKLPDSYQNLWIEQYEANFAKNKKVLKIRDKLKQNGYKIAVLSNTIPEHADYNKKHGTFNGFDAVVLSNEVRLRKPDEKIYRLTAQKLVVRPEECVYIDDREKFLTPAAKLGMKTIHYKNAGQLEAGLKEYGIKF